MTERSLKKFDYQFINNGDSLDLAPYSALYSDGFLNSIFSRLQITNDFSKNEMKEAILYAAMYFELAKRNYIEAYIAKNETRSILERFNKSIKKSREILNEISSQPTHRNQLVLNLKEIGKDRIKFSEISDLLSELQIVSEVASSGHIYTNFADSDAAVLNTWIDNLYSVWSAHSPIPLQAGHYHDEVGYNSEAYLVLCDLMKPLDRKVPKSSIVTALKAANKKFKQST